MADEKVIVEVIWDDAVTQDGYPPISAIRDMPLISRGNTGYLVSANYEEVVILFGDLNNLMEGRVAADRPYGIPWGMIRMIKKLGVVDANYKDEILKKLPDNGARIDWL